MPPELDALLALADDLYNHGQRQETLKVIENIYALYDLDQLDCNDLQARQLITNHNNPRISSCSSHTGGS